MLKYIKGITNESIIEAYARIKVADRAIESCTCQDLELDIIKIYTVNRSAAVLPLLIADACSVYATLEEVQNMDEKEATEDAPAEEEKKGGKGKKKKEETKKENERIKAGLATRFNNRVIDLRTPTS